MQTFSKSSSAWAVNVWAWSPFAHSWCIDILRRGRHERQLKIMGIAELMQAHNRCAG